MVSKLLFIYLRNYLSAYLFFFDYCLSFIPSYALTEYMLHIRKLWRDSPTTMDVHHSQTLPCQNF